MISVDALKKMSFLREASAESIQRLATDMVEKKFQPDDVVLKEGEKSDAIYIIVEGTARIEKSLDKTGDRSKVVARLEKEEIFGEMSFLENKPLSASVVADTPMLVYVLHRSSLEKLSASDSAAALDQVMTLFSGMSRRLRRTTTELVTVFEVARILVQDAPLKTIVPSVIGQLQMSLGESTPVAFYRWNLFNDEFDLVSSQQPGQNNLFPATLEKLILDQKQGELAVKLIQLGKNWEGLLAFSVKTVFDSGARQMIDTVSGLLAPALATLRLREEEESRSRLERSRQENLYS